MDPLDRSLYLGFVIGDDRAQPPAVVEQFRASGLAHLSAVSGENVAFLLAVAGPGLRRLGGPARWAVTLALIGWFAVITRFEPSVIRASVMAALACTGVALGRAAGTTRLLSLTVIGVLLADPLLVRDVGWWLSVGATAGIAVLARPLAARLPGPAALRAGLAVTVSAQLGVAPVSVAVFGPLPVASVPANLLAVPAAGPVMVYGLPAGLTCSALPDPMAWLLQLPTVLLVRWIARVAAWGAAAPLPALGGPAMVGVAIAVAVVLSRPPRRRR
jgi:competence protein ComEC